MIKVWNIPGGIHPPENKSQSNCQQIRKVGIPPEIILPLNQHIGIPASPSVAVGDQVAKGQCIADAQGVFSARVHAPTSGRVVAIEDRAIPHPSGLAAPCIVIETDQRDQWLEAPKQMDTRKLSQGDIVSAIHDAGLAGLGGAGFPTSVKLQPKPGTKIDTLIVNGTECEPYITADDVLMRERAHDILQGCHILARAFDERPKVVIGIEDNKPEAIQYMQAALAHLQNTEFADDKADNISIATFPTKYPSGGEKQLIQILTGREVPAGKIPAELGIVVVNVGTAAAAYRAVAWAEPLLSRVTTLTGDAIDTLGNVEVLIGTPIDFLLEEAGFRSDDCSRVIVGGPMMGHSILHTHAPIIKTTNCIIAATEAELPLPPPAQPCIRCGMCSEACPASLLPQQLYWYARAEDYDKLESYNLFDCIECGACSYVCPSNIPLVQYYRASKGIINKQRMEKQKADRARERFEARKERIERAEAEKEAKREARKQAAQAAKQAMETKAKPGEAKHSGEAQNPATAETSQGSNTNAGLVAAALQRVATKSDDPEQQIARATRALKSAESRRERAQSAIENARQENATDERQSKLLARLKQAELKVEDAQHQLDQLKNTSPQQPDASADSASSKTPESATQNISDIIDDAASAAIKRAQEKVEAQAQLSDSEKHAAHIASLQKRLSKAKERLTAAEAENSEHIDAFKSAYQKLEKKLKDAQSENSVS